MAIKITDIGELTTFNSDKNRIIRMTGMDMIIEEGRISEIDEGLPDADEKVDASGRLVTPGFVDALIHTLFLPKHVPMNLVCVFLERVIRKSQIRGVESGPASKQCGRCRKNSYWN